ncbi:membrane protein, OmpA family [Flavobacteriales bacterium ALC-1]|nr:membrane protein, OmpA family [Flavobacteriales bacterium ALC-1]
MRLFKITQIILLGSIFFSCNNKAKEEHIIPEKDATSSNQESLLDLGEDFLESTGISNDSLNAYLEEGRKMEELFQDSVAVGNMLEDLIKEGDKREKTEKQMRESGNMDDFLDAFNKLNDESGVAATIAKLKKADSLTGKNSFGSFEADPEMLEAMSEEVTLENSGKMTKEEREMIRGFNKTKNSIHSIEEIEQFKKMMEETDLDNMVEEGKVTQKYATTLKKEFKGSATTLKDREKRAERAKRDFKKQNPDLYFGEDVGMTYFGNRAKAVYLPLGKLSFADEVIHYYHPENEDTPSNALGEPNGYQIRSEKLANVHSLGLKGTLTIKFENNALIDVNGPDLYIFEMGAIEPTRLEISKDGKNWIEVGKIDGGVAQVDIHGFVKPNELFYYVRLTDLETSSGIPGADVDAIGAIGAAMRLNLDSKVLFDSGKSELKPEGLLALKELAKNISVLKSGNVIIEGHTDDVGSSENNKNLSLARAKSVSTELKKLIPSKTFKWREKGYGEKKPLVENNSEKNRTKNRRVEILILPN